MFVKTFMFEIKHFFFNGFLKYILKVLSQTKNKKKLCKKVKNIYSYNNDLHKLFKKEKNNNTLCYIIHELKVVTFYLTFLKIHTDKKNKKFIVQNISERRM